MLKVRAKDELRLDQRKITLKKTMPLMRAIAKDRRANFQRRYEEELNPQDKPLRNLSAQYQEWKNRNYPGKKKRELTGETRLSHRVTITDKALKEEVGGNAYWLQYFLELPLLAENPDEDIEEILARGREWLNQVLS